MLCSKLDCHKVLIEKPFHMFQVEVPAEPVRSRAAAMLLPDSASQAAMAKLNLPAKTVRSILNPQTSSSFLFITPEPSVE